MLYFYLSFISMFETLKAACWRRKFRKNLMRGRSDRDLGVRDAQSTAVYYAYEGEAEWARLQVLLQELAPRFGQIRILVSVPEKGEGATEAPALSSPFETGVLGKGDLDFCGMPKKGKTGFAADFFSRKYDFFVDYSREYHGLDAAVSSMIRAKVKIGKGGKWGEQAHDFILAPQDEGAFVESFTRTLQTYLPVILQTTAKKAETVRP